MAAIWDLPSPVKSPTSQAALLHSQFPGPLSQVMVGAVPSEGNIHSLVSTPCPLGVERVPVIVRVQSLPPRYPPEILVVPTKVIAPVVESNREPVRLILPS